MRVGERRGDATCQNDRLQYGASRMSASRARSLVVFGAVVLLGPGVALAQPVSVPTDADLRAEADALFKRLLVKPNDLDVAFRFSEIETKLGDYEAAIGALERMLFYNPNLPRVKLELGLLYFKLRSYEM